MEGYLRNEWNQQIGLLCKLEEQLDKFQIVDIDSEFRCSLCPWVATFISGVWLIMWNETIYLAAYCLYAHLESKLYAPKKTPEKRMHNPAERPLDIIKRLRKEQKTMKPNKELIESIVKMVENKTFTILR